jgi:hypothetical protein
MWCRELRQSRLIGIERENRVERRNMCAPVRILPPAAVING